MQAFLTLLATYYVCEGLAFENRLTQDGAWRCVSAYESLMLAHLTEDERRAVAEMSMGVSYSAHAGYLRFREWEAGNAEMVESFKQAARVVVLSME